MLLAILVFLVVKLRTKYRNSNNPEVGHQAPQNIEANLVAVGVPRHPAGARKIKAVMLLIEGEVFAHVGGAVINPPRALLPAADEAMAKAGEIAKGDLIAFVNQQPALITHHVAPMDDNELDKYCASLAAGAKWLNYPASTDNFRYNVLVILHPRKSRSNSN
jgi:hypothetical protein